MIGRDDKIIGAFNDTGQVTLGHANLFAQVDFLGDVIHDEHRLLHDIAGFDRNDGVVIDAVGDPGGAIRQLFALQRLPGVKDVVHLGLKPRKLHDRPRKPVAHGSADRIALVAAGFFQEIAIYRGDLQPAINQHHRKRHAAQKHVVQIFVPALGGIGCAAQRLSATGPWKARRFVGHSSGA